MFRVFVLVVVSLLTCWLTSITAYYTTKISSISSRQTNITSDNATETTISKTIITPDLSMVTNQVMLIGVNDSSFELQQTGVTMDSSFKLSGCKTIQVDSLVRDTNNKGIQLEEGSTGAVKLTGTNYTGVEDGLLKLNTNGTIERANASISTGGNLECKDMVTQKVIGSNSGSTQLSLHNSSGRGVDILPTTGAVKLTGTNYTGFEDGLLKLNTNGTIERANASISTGGN